MLQSNNFYTTCQEPDVITPMVAVHLHKDGEEQLSKTELVHIYIYIYIITYILAIQPNPCT